MDGNSNNNYVLDNRPVFKNQPIMCPWVSSQPYPSAQLLKNRLDELAKKHGTHSANSSSSTKTDRASSSSSVSAQPTSSTHFFYFLRLIQLFPDTHPATLHTVLTLSKHNFFFAIDKLLYAKKCKTDISRKLNNIGGRGRGPCFNSKGKQVPPFPRPSPNPRYQPLPRNMSADLAEVQRIIDLAEKPYLEVQSVENGHANVDDGQQMANRIVNICPEQLVHGTQTFMATQNNEVIEIVCFDNNNSALNGQDREDDAMDIETFDQNVENIVPSIGEGMSMGGIGDDSEPPVIVVGAMQDTDDPTVCLNQGPLLGNHHDYQQETIADSANSVINEEIIAHDSLL